MELFVVETATSEIIFSLNTRQALSKYWHPWTYHTTQPTPSCLMRLRSCRRSRQTPPLPFTGPFNRTKSGEPDDLVSGGRAGESRGTDAPFLPGQEDKRRLPSLRGEEAKKLSDAGMPEDFLIAPLDRTFARRATSNDEGMILRDHKEYVSTGTVHERM